ncbi:MAG: hypothetical protein U0872_06400 [Planctomycetaceae bacterium]
MLRRPPLGNQVASAHDMVSWRVSRPLETEPYLRLGATSELYCDPAIIGRVVLPHGTPKRFDSPQIAPKRAVDRRDLARRMSTLIDNLADLHAL